MKLPTGKASRLFINELTIWLDHHNRSTPFKSIELKVFMTLPCLLLQKSPRNSKAKDHLKTLEGMKKKYIRWLVKLERLKIAFEILPIQNVPKTIVLVHSQN